MTRVTLARMVALGTALAMSGTAAAATVVPAASERSNPKTVMVTGCLSESREGLLILIPQDPERDTRVASVTANRAVATTGYELNPTPAVDLSMLRQHRGERVLVTGTPDPKPDAKVSTKIKETDVQQQDVKAEPSDGHQAPKGQDKATVSTTAAVQVQLDRLHVTSLDVLGSCPATPHVGQWRDSLVFERTTDR